MEELLNKLRFYWLYFKWKRRTHRRRRPAFSVGNLPAFFQQLNEIGVVYVVLRWFDEIPLSPEEERKYDGDLDLMVDSRYFRQFCRVAAAHPGKIKIDLYSEGVQMGTGYAKLPYYPPPKALEILENRVIFKQSFYVPEPKIYLYSLCYHLVYHKGLLSGLETGMEDLKNSIANKHQILEELELAAKKADEILPTKITLFSLHQWLVSRYWNMPYDLLARWGKTNDWHTILRQYEEKRLSDRQGTLHDILVFMIREDAVRQKADSFIREKLAEKFVILDNVQLDSQALRRVMNETRGADWTKHKSTLLIPPVYAVVCFDPKPQKVPKNSKLGAIHVNVHNNNVFYKHQLREWLDERYPGSAGNFLHGSDNDLESMAYLIAVYGEDKFQDARERLQTKMTP